MKRRNTLFGSLITAIALSLTLAAFGLLIGWNVWTLLIYWIVAVPIIANVSAHFLSGGRTFQTAVTGLLMFYLLVLFMIYKHYQSDYFTVMKYSFFSTFIFLFTYHYNRLFPSTKVS